METRLLLLLLVGAVSLLLVLLAIPMIWRQVPPSRAYGLRVSATREDSWVWYETNARSGRALVVVGGLGLALAVALYPIPGLTSRAYAGVTLGALGTGTFLVAVRGWRVAERLLREHRRAQRAGRPRPAPHGSLDVGKR